MKIDRIDAPSGKAPDRWPSFAPRKPPAAPTPVHVRHDAKRMCERVGAMRRTLLALAAIPLLVGSAPVAPASARTTLPSFDTCDDLVAFARRGVSRPQVDMRAMGGFGGLIQPRAPIAEPAPRDDKSGPFPMPAIAVAASPEDSAAGSAPTEAFSGTNTQESTVDEPDVVKTDGKRMFVVAGTELWAFDVTGDVPKVISKLNLEGAGGELLLRGDRLLLIGSAPATSTSPTTPSPPSINDAPTSTTPISMPSTAGSTASPARRAQVVAPTVPVPVPEPSDTSVALPPPSKARLAEIDVRNTAAMKIVRTMLVPGSIVSARLSGGSIRVVLNSPAAIPDTATTQAATTASAAKATAKTLRLRNFVPRTVLSSRRTHRTFRRNLVPCDHVRHPSTFSGLDLLTVLTVNFDDGLFNVDRDAVMASAQVVYASERNLYVASMPAADIAEPSDVPARAKTEIHRFDASEPGHTTYTSSGAVPGFILNQYAMSEHAGDLRVAATESPLWIPGASTLESESAVTVLRSRGSVLEQVGRVSGLGKGERIYATRFIGDVGYLVTFRQTDPLYTLDLADPTAPKVAGELKINGYSAYLHPIGDNLLLGVGQDATDTGRRIGAQASIFDVSNPATPTRTAQLPLGNGGAAVEFDPHAFLWWAPSKLAILPVAGYDPTTYRSLQSAVGLKAGRAEGLTKVGEITHGPAWDQGQIDRSVVVGDRVFTISDFGVGANRMPGLQSLGFASFKPAG